MSLAEVKKKRKIGQDPNNKCWSDNKNGMGYKLLQKMGWSEGKGLGVNLDGVQEHVKIETCNENLGIGADLNYADKWIEGASSYEDLLNRLNSDQSCCTDKKEKIKHEKKKKKSKEPKKAHIEKHDSDRKKRKTEAKLNEEQKIADSCDTQPLNLHLSYRHKFIKNKNVRNYSEEDLKAIFGEK